MSGVDLVVLMTAIALTAFIVWFFFGPKKSQRAEFDDGVQVVRVTVKGGYSPEVIQVIAGAPVRLLFDRQETGDCSSRVVFPDFKVNETLPAYQTTAVEFVPEMAGEYGFACGMNIAPRQAPGRGRPGVSCCRRGRRDRAFGGTRARPGGAARESLGERRCGPRVLARDAGRSPIGGRDGPGRVPPGRGAGEAGRARAAASGPAGGLAVLLPPHHPRPRRQPGLGGVRADDHRTSRDAGGCSLLHVRDGHAPWPPPCRYRTGRLTSGCPGDTVCGSSRGVWQRPGRIRPGGSRGSGTQRRSQGPPAPGRLGAVLTAPVEPGGGEHVGQRPLPRSLFAVGDAQDIVATDAGFPPVGDV
jgi:hypothetical protein